VIFINRSQKDTGAVTARLLGVVESHIGAGKHGAGRFVAGSDGEPDAKRDGEGKSRDGNTTYRLF